MNVTTTSLIRATPLIALAVLGLSLVLTESATNAGPEPSRLPIPAAGASAVVAGLETVALRLAEERGHAYAALHAPAPIHDLERIELDARRAESDAMLDEALGQVESVLGPGQSAVLRVNAARRYVASMRGMIDRALDSPADTRPRALARRWLLGTTELIEGIHDSARFAGMWWTGNEPGFQALVAVQRYAWRISDAAGQERALIGAAIASGQPMSAAERHALVVVRQRLESDWRRLAQIAGGMNLVPDLAADLERARRALFDDLASAQGRVLDASERHAAYPFTTGQWFAAASRSIEAIVALRRNAGRAAVAPSAWQPMRSSAVPRARAERAGDV